MIDLDHNATTSLDPCVREVMLAALELGNPSSTHARGRAAREALDAARREAAAALGCEPGELVFTASGSEANALALSGAFQARREVSRRVLVSAIEHPSILETAKRLPGAELVSIPVDERGVVRVDALQAELTHGAAVCAVMWANNETGAIQPIGEVARLARAAGVPYHCDAVQAAGKLALGRATDRADLLSISAHKFRGPKGAGGLVVKRGMQLAPLVGGHQERGRRGGTENVAGAVGLARALSLAVRSHDHGLWERSPDRDLPSTTTVAVGRPLPQTSTSGPSRVTALRDRFEAAVAGAFPDARIHAHAASRLGNTSSVHFPGVDGEALLIALDLNGVCASLGAACSSGALSASHVLLAMGVPAGDARSSLRFSFGPENTEAEVERVVVLLKELVPKARR